VIYLALLAFFFLEYVRPASYVPALMALHLNSIVPLAAFFGSVATAGAASMQRMLAEPNTRVFGAFLGLIWLSVLFADVQEFAYNRWTISLGFSFMYWVIGSEVTTLARLKGVFKTLIGVHLIVAALNPLLFTDPSVRHYVSSGSFLGDGNDFALSIVVILPLCLFLLLDARRTVMKLFWACGLVVLVAGVVVTQSRGGTVGLGCMGIYYWMKSRKKVQTAMVAAVVVVLVLALAPGSYFERMNMIGDTQEGSAQARILAWRVAVRMALDSPVLGVGAGHFGIKFGNEYRPPEAVGRGMTAHSIYFLALGELGFPGLFLLLYFIGSNLSENRRLAQEIRGRDTETRDSDLQMLASMSAGVVAFASAGAFLSAIYYPHWFVLGGLMSASRRLVRERTASVERSRPVEGPAPEISYHWALRRPVPTWNSRPADQPRMGSPTALARRSDGPKTR
jgi:putative inorganic carbon (HCO3(-)) transporter